MVILLLAVDKTLCCQKATGIGIQRVCSDLHASFFFIVGHVHGTVDRQTVTLHCALFSMQPYYPGSQAVEPPSIAGDGRRCVNVDKVDIIAAVRCLFHLSRKTSERDTVMLAETRLAALQSEEAVVLLDSCLANIVPPVP